MPASRSPASSTASPATRACSARATSPPSSPESATSAARISRRALLAGLALAPAVVHAQGDHVIAHLGIRYGRAERFRAPRPEPPAAPLGTYGPSPPPPGAARPGARPLLID